MYMSRLCGCYIKFCGKNPNDERMITILRRIQTCICYVLFVFAFIALSVLVSCEDASYLDDRTSSSDSILNENTIPFILFGLVGFLVILILLLVFALPKKKNEQAYDMLIATNKNRNVYFRIVPAMSDLMTLRNSLHLLDGLEIIPFPIHSNYKTEKLEKMPLIVDIQKDRIRVTIDGRRANRYGTPLHFKVQKIDGEKVIEPTECKSFIFEPETNYILSYVIDKQTIDLFFFFASDREMMKYMKRFFNQLDNSSHS